MLSGKANASFPRAFAIPWVILASRGLPRPEPASSIAPNPPTSNPHVACVPNCWRKLPSAAVKGGTVPLHVSLDDSVGAHARLHISLLKHEFAIEPHLDGSGA